MTKAMRVLLFASLLFGTALFAAAQNIVRVQVPFDFHVGGKTLSAGSYTVSRALERDPGALRITGGRTMSRSPFWPAWSLRSMRARACHSFGTATRIS